MKFKRGNKVEVLRRIDVQCGSWFPGRIISVDGDQYVVRYEFFVNLEGQQIVEKVHREDVRPQPPPANEEGRWVLGDIPEVFHIHCWRVGKVVKVLRNNRFVIRLFNCIQLKEFHQSSLRLRHAWKNNKWVMIEKVGHDSSNYSLRFGDGTRQPGINPNADKNGQGVLNAFPLVRSLKRNCGGEFESLLDDGVMEFGCRRRKATTKVERCNELPRRTLPFSERVDAVSSPKSNIGKRCITGYSRTDVQTEKANNYSLSRLSIPIQMSEEINECSVASCSGNDFQEYNVQNSRKSSKDVIGNSLNDAQSFCPSASWRTNLQSCTEDELESNIRELELDAYKRTLQALYASGPLSWEQESLLTNLRLSLRISNEEHLLHLKQLLSYQVL